MDVYQICLDEVALEGLDGITISALWLRLNHREEKIFVKLSPTFQEILWKFLLQHASVEFYQLTSERNDPVIFNRFLGIDVTSGKHIALAPDELDLLEDIYYVKPISNQPNIKGSCPQYDTRVNVSSQLRSENLSLSAATDRYGEQRLVIVASQSMREGVLRGAGITSQTVESLTDIEYCILERIGRSRWQGEIQTVLNNFVFKQLKSAHIHYMMKSLFQKGLVTKQPYSYVREDKGGKVYQQILLHLPHFKTDARSVSDIRAETICEILKQSENKSISCNDLRQIISVEGKVFRKLATKMIAAGYVKTESVTSSKHSEKMMTLIKTPAEKQEEEILDDSVEDTNEANSDSVGLISELPLTLQGFRHIFSTGENGCSQAMLHRRLKGYGSLEARHLCRKVEKAKIVKIIMIDHGKQRTQKYIAENFARSSKHTKQFFEEKKKMQKIMETSDLSLHTDSSSLNGSAEVIAVDELALNDGRALELASYDGNVENSNNAKINPVSETEGLEIRHSNHLLHDNDVIEIDMTDSSVKKSKWDTHQTTRKMKRTNLILRYINEQKVVEGFFALQKVLQSEEKDEGLTTKVCKKTVKRLVQKLHNESLIKHFTVPITSNDCTVEVDFVMSLDCDSLRLKTAIEQAQFKKYSEDSKKIAAEQAEVIDLTSPSFSLTSNLHSPMNLTDIVKIEDCRPNNKLQYGYQPKFLRNQIVHEYLWYLAYGHPYNEKENLEILDYDKVREYNPEKNWKRFLPPVPPHPDFGPGWLQVGDVAVLLPLSILCQFHQYPYKIEGIEQYISDPVRKNTLVRHLPLKMRGLIFYKRKYLLSLIQVIENLCFMGLVTFNKQKKNVNIRTKKEFEMIYIHRNITILDTRKSEKGYNEVSDGIIYEQMRFQLNEFSDVTQYWFKLRDICLMTPLGVRVTEDPESESVSRHTVKLKLYIAEHVARENWEPCDDGSIPGDHRGAAGLDSSLFAYLYRNWFRTVKVTKNANEFDGSLGLSGDSETAKEKVVRLPKLKPTNFILNEESSKKPKRKSKQNDSSVSKTTSRKRSSNTNSNLNLKKQKLNGSDPVIVESKESVPATAPANDKSPNYELITECNIGRNERVKGGRGGKRGPPASETSSAVTKPKQRKRAAASNERKGAKKVPDLLDKQARDNMNGKYRVSFSSAEDELLLMCRIASTVMGKTVKVKQRLETQNVVPGSVFRDLLWKHSKASHDKTSSSCLRRIRFLLRAKGAKICHDINAADILADQDTIKELFKDVKHLEILDDSEQIKTLYHKVFVEVHRRFRNTRPENNIVIPDTIEELNKLYTTRCFSADIKEKDIFRSRSVKEIASPRDITISSLENLMYATLSLNEDEFSQYQAYKIFSNYSKELISQVWERFKLSGLVCKKPDLYLSRLRHLPFTVPVYHLSHSHFQNLQAEKTWKLFSELTSSFNELCEKGMISCDMNTSSGPVVLLNLFLLKQLDTLHVELPNSNNEVEQNRFKSSDVRSQSSSSPVQGNENDASDDDESQNKNSVTEKELISFYGRKRFAESNKPFRPVLIRADSSIMSKTNSYLPSVTVTIDQLESVKKSHSIIAIDDIVDDGLAEAMNNVIEKNAALDYPVRRIVSIVESAGIFGVPLPEIRKNLQNDSRILPHQLDACISNLKSENAIYIVGMWNERAVLKKYSDKWFVNGIVFKGDRQLLREEIKKELTCSNNKNCKFQEKSQEADDNQLISSDTLASSSNSDDVGGSAPRFSLFDASNYNPVSFICRPWHNVCGEVNHRTAKLLLTGVFVHILWYPGVSFLQLTERFITIMQRIVLIELIEKLINCKCIDRQKSSRRKQWKLFQDIETDLTCHVIPSDDDHFRVTMDGILRMTVLCRELDRLQEERYSSLCLTDEENQ